MFDPIIIQTFSDLLSLVNALDFVKFHAAVTEKSFGPRDVVSIIPKCIRQGGLQIPHLHQVRKVRE